MNFELSEDQSTVLSGLDQLLVPYQATPIEPITHQYSEALANDLAQSGFLDIAREEGFSVLDAALIVEQVAKAPQVVEAAASAIVGPILPAGLGAGSIALAFGHARAPIRFLSVAKQLVILRDDRAEVIELTADDVEPVENLLAYPYGRLRNPNNLRGVEIADAVAVRKRWQIALAVEGAACMGAALDVVLEHVKTRFAFGRPLGSLQAIQHRLAMAAETAESAKWLARRAAWSDTAGEAAMAAAHVQNAIPQITYDLHQFSGAMGLTLEFPLHFWTYRLRALAGELGGGSVQTRLAAEIAWSDAA